MEVPAVLDDNGNINLHNQQGVLLHFGFETLPDVPKDVSLRTYFFETSSGFRQELTNGSTTDTKILTVEPEEFQSILNEVVDYVILDETETQHELIMQGALTVRGF